MRLPVGIALITACVLNAQNIGKGVNFYSMEKETALGAELAMQYRANHSPLDSPTVRDYVEQMGQRLIAALPQPSPFPYHFELTTESSGTFVEPVALPGGYIFVPAGLILEAQDEAEFAGTLAHAMAHILARHYTRQATKAQIGGMGTANIPLIFVGGANNGPLLPVGLMQFQRAMESEADRIAVSVAAAAGYDPEGLPRYIGREQQDPTRPEEPSALPRREGRVQAMEKAIQALPPQNYPPSRDFARIQDEVRRAVPPNLPRPATAPTLKQAQER